VKREVQDQPAGLRTHIVVCGALPLSWRRALLPSGTSALCGDPSRYDPIRYFCWRGSPLVSAFSGWEPSAAAAPADRSMAWPPLVPCWWQQPLASR